MRIGLIIKIQINGVFHKELSDKFSCFLTTVFAKSLLSFLNCDNY